MVRVQCFEDDPYVGKLVIVEREDVDIPSPSAVDTPYSPVSTTSAVSTSTEQVPVKDMQTSPVKKSLFKQLDRRTASVEQLDKALEEIDEKITHLSDKRENIAELRRTKLAFEAAIAGPSRAKMSRQEPVPSTSTGGHTERTPKKSAAARSRSTGRRPPSPPRQHGKDPFDSSDEDNLSTVRTEKFEMAQCAYVKAPRTAGGIDKPAVQCPYVGRYLSFNIARHWKDFHGITEKTAHLKPKPSCIRTEVTEEQFEAASRKWLREMPKWESTPKHRYPKYPSYKEPTTEDE